MSHIRRRSLWNRPDRHWSRLLFTLASASCALLAHADEASWNAAIEAEAPLHWYRFTESAGTATLADSGSAAADADVMENLILAEEGLLGSSTAARFNSGGIGYATMGVSSNPQGKTEQKFSNLWLVL